MKTFDRFCLGVSALLLSGVVSFAEPKPIVEHKDNDHATPAFKFANVPAPAKTNAALQASLVIVDGTRDENAAELNALHDGKLPSAEDEPSANFFFAEATDGGRLLMDLGKAIDIKQVNTYSWHPGTRAPQVYKLYGSDGKPDGFDSKPKRATDPEKAGWKLIASVDTRPKAGEGGGQYGVSISDSAGMIGHYRYLLFDISRTEKDTISAILFTARLPSSAARGAKRPKRRRLQAAAASSWRIRRTANAI